MTTGWVGAAHGRPRSRKAQPKALRAAAVPQRSEGAVLAEGEPDGALEQQARHYCPTHPQGRTCNEAHEPPATGDIANRYV